MDRGQPPPGPPTQGRTDRYRLVGSISGTVVGAILIFGFLAFGEHPHRLRLAVITTLIFLVVSGIFDYVLFRQAKGSPGSPGARYRAR